jgi:hypothetical protein
MTWPGNGTKLLSSDGSQVVVGSGLDLSAGQLSATGPTWPGASSQMVASDGSTISVGSGLSLTAGTITSTDVKCTYVPTITGDGSTQLVASSVGDVIYSGDGIYVCTALSPLTWKKFSVNSTIDVPGTGVSVSYRYYRMVIKETRNSLGLPGYAGSTELVMGLQLQELELLSNAARISYAGSTASSTGTAPGAYQDASKAIDNNSATKWFVYETPTTASPITFKIDFGTARQANGFRYMTGGDAAARDPLRWSFEGSNNDSTWTVLHTQSTNASITTSRTTYTQEFMFTS